MKRRVARKIIDRLHRVKSFDDVPYTVDQYARAFAAMRRLWVRGHTHVWGYAQKFCTFQPHDERGNSPRRQDFYRMNRLHSAVIRKSRIGLLARGEERTQVYPSVAICPRTRGLSPEEIAAFAPRRAELVAKHAQWSDDHAIMGLRGSSDT